MSSPVFTNLDQARERFVNDLQQLKEGENPAPYIENYLQAVLAALRIAIRLIGRPKVVIFSGRPTRQADREAAAYCAEVDLSE